MSTWSSGWSRSARPSSTSPDSCRCTPPRSPRFAATPASVTSSATGRRRPASSSPPSGPGSSTPWYGRCSHSWSAASGCSPDPGRAGPASTTCDTASRWRPCWTGTATASMLPPACRCCRPTSATPARRRPTGICRPPPNCWAWPPNDSSAERGSGDDRVCSHHRSCWLIRRHAELVTGVSRLLSFSGRRMEGSCCGRLSLVSGRRMERVMSMQPQPWPQPAQEIVDAVRAMYARRRAPLAVQVRDQLGELFADAQFVGAFGVRGKPAWSPGRLALVTVLQMAEALSDRQAAEAGGDKLSWKYALGLGLGDPGFDASVLSEFRTRVVTHGLEERVLDLLLAALQDKGLVKAGGKQRTDSTHVVAAVRDLNRLELAGESVRACLEALAVAAPGWLAATIDVAGWGLRYGRRIDSWRLPTAEAKRAELATAYGQDGFWLLAAVYAADTPGWLRELPAVEVLRVVLVQNYTRTITSDGREVVRRREADPDGLPPGRLRLTSPYDTDARWGVKRDTFWNGYEVHLSETCDTPDGAHTIGADACKGPAAPSRQAAWLPNLITDLGGELHHDRLGARRATPAPPGAPAPSAAPKRSW